MDMDDNMQFVLEFEEDLIKSHELGKTPQILPTQPELLDPTAPVFTEAECIKGSYMSIEFTTVQKVENNKSLLILRFTCHPVRNRRFSTARIAVKFQPPPPPPPSDPGPSPTPPPPPPPPPPKLVLHAPRRSYGGCTRERTLMKWGLTLPLQLGFGSASFSAEPSVQREVEKEVEHAMTITGTARGAPFRTSCVWTAEENKSAAIGIPGEFQVAVVVQHQGPFVAVLDVQAELRGRFTHSFLKSKSKAGKQGVMKLINVDGWKTDVTYAGGNWRALVEKMTGEVPGAVGTFQQQLIAN